RKLGQPRIDALREENRRRGIEVARAWTRADDQSTQAFYQLSQSFNAARQPDSATMVLRDALRKPRSGSAMARLALLQYEEAAGDTGAANTLAYILDRYNGDSLAEIPGSSRFALEGPIMTWAAMEGR